MVTTKTFDEFCQKYCDGLHDPRFTYENQCTGYKLLRKMVEENIQPASLNEIETWENNPSVEEIFSEPDIKYLRFLHPLLRKHIVANWDTIKRLPL